MAQVEDARGYIIEGNVFENTADTPTQLRTKPLELNVTAADIRFDAEGDVELASHPTDSGKTRLEFKLRNATLYSVTY